MFAYGSIANSIYEYIKIRKGSSLECLKLLYRGVIACFEAEYIHHPTIGKLRHMLAKGDERRFHGMLGSIDCVN